MAIATLEGTLWIDLVDVYSWIEGRGTSTDGVRRLFFSREQDALVVEIEGRDSIEVDAAEFWAWVIDKQLPKGVNHFETVFGVPNVQGHDLVVTFAASSDADPRSWSVPPKCLAEWK